MEYLTAYYRQQEEGGCSLLLQQYLCRQTPVCFACLCTAEAGKAGGACRNAVRLFWNWSRKVPWHRAAVRPIPYLKRLEGELTDLLDSAESGFGNAADAGRLKLTLLLGLGKEILALGSGQSIWLLSVFFGRGKAVRLPGQFRGCLEPGAGLLLASEGFLKNVEGKGLEEALGLWEIRTEQQAERRLKELAVPRVPASSGRGASEEGEPRAAVLLVGR